MESEKIASSDINADNEINPDMETNSEVNRSNHEVINEMPAQIEKHLDFIESNSNGHLLLGSSNLTGRYWCGSVWLYTDPTVAPDINGSKAGIEFSGGVTDCAFISKDRAIVGEDGGILNFVTIKDPFDKTPQIIKTQEIDDHGYSITSIKITCDRKLAITSSMDKSIRLWDCQTAISTCHYTPAHSQEVSSLSTHPTQPNLLLSSSIDGNVLIWDFRCSRPASCVFRDIDDCPSSVCWLENDDSKFITGTLSGKICLRSSKTWHSDISTAKYFNRPIFRMKPNKLRKNQVAVCANDTTLHVIEVEDEEIITRYNNSEHTDFVRGLTWLDEHMLVSCGWDKKVYFHNIV